MRSLAAIAALSLSLVALPAAARADDPLTASVTLTDLGASKDGTFNRVRVDWTSSCPPGSTTDTTSYFRYVQHSPKGKRTLGPKEQAFETAGSQVDEILAGRRVSLLMYLSCGPDDESVPTQSGFAESNTIYIPPRITGWSVERGSYCNTSQRQQRKGVGAADFQTLNWKLVFGGASFLESVSMTTILEGVRLRASGKGLRFRYGPRSGPARKYGVYQGTIFTPRSGSVKLWAEIGGVATNKITVPVVGKPCVTNPWSYYGRRVMSQANPFIRD